MIDTVENFVVLWWINYDSKNRLIKKEKNEGTWEYQKLKVHRVFEHYTP